MHASRCWKTTTAAASSPPDKSQAARFQEIFVDLVGMICTIDDAASRHVLDDLFDCFLGEGERAFKKIHCWNFSKNKKNESKSMHAFAHLEDILGAKMGFRNAYRRANKKNTKRLSDLEEKNIAGNHPGDATKLEVCKWTCFLLARTKLEDGKHKLEALTI
jgi:hypothetical protein